MDDEQASAAVEVFGTPITLVEVLTAVGILVAAGVMAFVLRRIILRRSRTQQSSHIATWYTLSRLVAYTVLVVGFILAISALGVPLSDFAVVAGALGVGLGFGLQTLFSNFISGVVLLLDKSLKIGDFVELESGVTGEVRDIKIRATTIVTNDNIDILVPNSEFVAGRVVNWTHRDVLRRLRVPFGVAYGTEKNVVKKAALEAAAAVPFTLHLDGPQRPQVWLSKFDTSSLNFELVIWLNPEATKKPVAVTAAYNWALHSALQAHGIEIPFPQRDLHVKTLFGLSEDDACRALGLAENVTRDEAGSRHSQPTTGGKDKDDDVDSNDHNDAADDVNADNVPDTAPEARPSTDG
ncbi:small-conductance mechanosensitive channel [Arthrobacter sp. CAN_A212]|uniref:mechanosensitive ion channel family protein n=1 Tax=unclassified Arthrobacter TaxID=235627 RepID=UPI001A29703F|nr:mechanosensitive ion channel domain-containing protein [Arthrobacter sp. CAN_C5]MBP2218054.1 small-conductance mechanosensitive channel [Arthrobacter sp. CAN_C5]